MPYVIVILQLQLDSLCHWARKREGSDNLFFARRPIGSCNLVLFIHHRLMRGEKSVHNSRIGAKPFVHCET